MDAEVLMSTAREKQKDLRSKVRQANGDLVERTRDGLTVVQFDAEGDVLYIRLDRVSSGDPLIVVETADPHGTMSLVVEGESLKIVGFDIINFRSQHLPNDEQGRRLFEPLFEVLDQGDFRLEVRNNEQFDLYVPARVEMALAEAA